jgi:hypothetical protein
MMGLARHLSDDRLYEYYLADRTGDSLEPPVADHLADCASCAARYAEFTRWFDAVRAEGDAEIDAIFTPDCLHEQQEHILRRIAHLNQRARVISFPGQTGHRITNPNGLTLRWLAAAAATGLFVGVAVGGMFLEPRLTRPAPAAMQAVSPGPSSGITPRPAVLVTTQASDTPDDDTFLSELEFALERPRTRELQPFDALTPLVQDVDNRLR